MVLVVEYAQDAKPLRIDDRFWVHQSSRFLLTSSKSTGIKCRLVAISCEHDGGTIHIPLVFRVHSKEYVIQTLRSWRTAITRKLYFEQFPAKTVWSAGSDYQPRPSMRTARVLVSIEGLGFMQSVPCHCTLIGNSLSYIQLENPARPNWFNFSLSVKTDVSFNGQTVTLTLHNGVPITLVLEFAKVLGNPQATAASWHLALQQTIELARHGFDDEESRLDDINVRYGTHASRRSLSLKRGILQIGSQETRFGLTPQCMLRKGSSAASIEIVFHRSHDPFFHKQKQQTANMNLQLRFPNEALASLWTDKLTTALQRCEDMFRRPRTVGSVGLYIPPVAFASSQLGSYLSQPLSTLLDRFSYPEDSTQPLRWRGDSLGQVETSSSMRVKALCVLAPDAEDPPELVEAQHIYSKWDMALKLEHWQHETVFVTFVEPSSLHEVASESETESEPEPEPKAPESKSESKLAASGPMTEVITIVTRWNEGWLNLRGQVELTRFISVSGNRIVSRKFAGGPALHTYELNQDSLITCDAENAEIHVSNLTELSDDGTRTDVDEPITFVCVSDGAVGKDPQADARRWELVLKRAVSEMTWPETPEGQKPRATEITVGSFVQFSMKRDRFHMWITDEEAKPLKNGRDVIAILSDNDMYGEGHADVVLHVEVKGKPEENQIFKVKSDTTVHIKDEYLVIMDLEPDVDSEDATTPVDDWNHFLVLKTVVGSKRKNSLTFQGHITTHWRELLEYAINVERCFMSKMEITTHMPALTPEAPDDEDIFAQSQSELAKIAQSYALPTHDSDDDEDGELDAFADAVVTYLLKRRLHAFLLRHRNNALHDADPDKILRSFFEQDDAGVAEDPTALLFQSLGALVVRSEQDQSDSPATDAESNGVPENAAAKRVARVAKLLPRAFDEIDKNLVFRNPRTGEEVDVVQLTMNMLLEVFWNEGAALSSLKVREIKCLPTYSRASANRADREGWMMVTQWFGMDLGKHSQSLRFCRIKDHSFICGATEKDVPEMGGQPWRAPLSENDLVEADGRHLRLVLDPSGSMQVVIELSCGSKAAAALWEQSFKTTFGTPVDVLVSSTLIVDAPEPSAWRSARPMMCKINNEELVVLDNSNTAYFPHQILLHADSIPGDPLAMLVVTQAPKDDDEIIGYGDDEDTELSKPVSLRLRAESEDVVNSWLEVFYKIVAVKGSRLNKVAIKKTVNNQLIFFKTHPGSAALPALTPQGPCMDDEAISADVMTIHYKRNIDRATNDLAADDASDEENDDTGATTIVTGDEKAGFMGGFLHISGAAVEAGALVDAKLWKKVRKAKGRKVLREIWMTGCILDTMRLSQLCAQLAEAELWRRVVRLDLTDTRLDDNGARALANAFTCDSGDMQLMYLQLDNNRIGDLGATHVAKLVYQSPTLASLSLSRNRFRDAGAGAIFQAMLCEGGARKAHSTASAAASAGKVTASQSRDDGDVSAAHALLTGGGSRSARGLTSLDLTQNRLTSSSAAVLASVLMDPKSRNAMRILDLSQNLIADFGATALVSAAVKSNVQILSLAHNSIGDAGAKRIASFLHTYGSGTSLSKINLSGNELSDSTAQDLHAVFQKLSVTVTM